MPQGHGVIMMAVQTQTSLKTVNLYKLVGYIGLISITLFNVESKHFIDADNCRKYQVPHLNVPRPCNGNNVLM